MKIAIYHPDLNLFGGGERVALTIASMLSEDNQVDLFTPYDVSKEALESYFNIDVSGIRIRSFGKLIRALPSLETVKPSLYLRNAYRLLNNYDLVIDTCTNGWFDKKLKPKTLCYIHFPKFTTKKTGLKSILNPLIIKKDRAFTYDKILCNSNFTKEFVSTMTDRELEVVYPPVEVESITPKKKIKRIVTIGRLTEDKKIDVMIEAFKRLKGLSFHIIGSFRENTTLYNKAYLDSLIEKAAGYPIHFHINLPHDEVLRFLEESLIYWHARGYGETDPHEYENFGITTVEAMAGGCVPIVINLGAQPEIVQNNKNGFCWDRPSDLIKFTNKVLSDKKLAGKLSDNAINDSKVFSSGYFRKEITTVLQSF
jgi:glycosyltransferase involved in cell wall biosynthesis